MDRHASREGISNFAFINRNPTEPGFSHRVEDKSPNIDRPTLPPQRTHSHPLLSLASSGARSLKGQHAVTGVSNDSAPGGDLFNPSPASPFLIRKFSHTRSPKKGNAATKGEQSLTSDRQEKHHRMDFSQAVTGNGESSIAPSFLNAGPLKESKPTETENKRLSFSSRLSMGSLHGTGPAPSSQASSVAGSFKASSMEQHLGHKEFRSPTMTSPNMDTSLSPTIGTENISTLSSTHTFPLGTLQNPLIVSP